MSGFTIRGLDPTPFAPLFGLTDAALAGRRARRHIADTKPGFPCRVTLEDAEPGEPLILVHYEHLPVDTPFRASHAIYLREGATDAACHVDAVPDQFRRRILSLRAFDATGMMIDADLVVGTQADSAIVRLLADRQVAYLHAHFAKFGCFAGRVDRR